MSVLAKIFLIVDILLAVALAVFKALDMADPAEMVGAQIGALIVLVGFPLLIAWLAAGRKKVRHPNRFVLIFCLISGFIILANSTTVFNFEQPEARFARLLREAAGVQPVSHHGFGRQRRFDDQVRDQYRKLLQQNRDYTEAVKQIDNSRVKDLNKAASFATPEAAQEGLAQLHALYDVDAAEEQKVRTIMADLRHVLETYASSPAERDDMLKGFDNSMSAQFAKRQEALDAEKAWVDAEDDVHAYADAHRRALSELNGHLVISDETVRSEFNTKIDTQEEKRKAFLKAQQQFSQSQADSLKKMGLSGKNLGGK
jgi:stress response protein YsnF